MRRKIRWNWILIAVAGIFIVYAGAAVIFAQEPAGEGSGQGEVGAPLLERPARSWHETFDFWHQQAHGQRRLLERFLKYGVDHDRLLADALDISVEELQNARKAARAGAIMQAVDLEIITQEEGDRILAFMTLSESISREELVAQALEISVEELRAARREGKKLPSLLEQQGLTACDFRDNLLTAFQDSIKEAVAVGAISQDQADLIMNESGLVLRRLFQSFHRPPLACD